jgi:hypothetical protein
LELRLFLVDVRRLRTGLWAVDRAAGTGVEMLVELNCFLIGTGLLAAQQEVQA